MNIKKKEVLKLSLLNVFNELTPGWYLHLEIDKETEWEKQRDFFFPLNFLLIVVEKKQQQQVYERKKWEHKKAAAAFSWGLYDLLV